MPSKNSSVNLNLLVKSKNSEIKKLKQKLKLKERQLEKKKKRLDIVKFKSCWKTPFVNQKTVQKRRLNHHTPTDTFSRWIQNPGISFIAEKIFGFCDTKTLNRCKRVSKVWNKFIGGTKSLILLQIHQLWNFKGTFLDRNNEKKTMTFYQKYEHNFRFLTHDDQIKEWKYLFEAVKNEKTKNVKDFYQKLKSTIAPTIGKRLTGSGNPKSFCLECGLLKNFEDVTKIYPIKKADISTFQARKYYNPRAFNLILAYMPKEGNIMPSGLLFNAFGNEKHKMQMLEILFQKAEELKIDFNETNRNGKTLLDIASGNDDTEVLQLFKKYNLQK